MSPVLTGGGSNAPRRNSIPVGFIAADLSCVLLDKNWIFSAQVFCDYFIKSQIQKSRRMAGFLWGGGWV